MSATDPIEVQLLANTDFESSSATTTIQSPQPQSTTSRTRRSRPRSSLVRSLLRNRKAVIGLIILAVFLLTALLAPVIAPDPSGFVR